jgi:hypothetical protein
MTYAHHSSTMAVRLEEKLQVIGLRCQRLPTIYEFLFSIRSIPVAILD